MRSGSLEVRRAIRVVVYRLICWRGVWAPAESSSEALHEDGMVVDGQRRIMGVMRLALSL